MNEGLSQVSTADLLTYCRVRSRDDWPAFRRWVTAHPWGGLMLRAPVAQELQGRGLDARWLAAHGWR